MSHSAGGPAFRFWRSAGNSILVSPAIPAILAILRSYFPTSSFASLTIFGGVAISSARRSGAPCPLR
jgi:hypothetical protein